MKENICIKLILKHFLVTIPIYYRNASNSLQKKYCNEIHIYKTLSSTN
jgi:hypothetical protein